MNGVKFKKISRISIHCTWPDGFTAVLRSTDPNVDDLLFDRPALWSEARKLRAEIEAKSQVA